MVSMANVLSRERRAAVVAALVEGNSIRSTVRMTGVAKNTVVKLMAELGAVCARYQDETLRDLTCKRLELDELWGFCYAKQKNVPAEKAGQFGYGDVWTFIAIDADTKLCPSFVVGSRDIETAMHFCQDLAGRCVGERVQITTDGLAVYLPAVEEGFGGRADYAMLQKIYASPSVEGQKRYSPAECIGCKKLTIQGRPEGQHISTSYIERQNLTVRMSMRRFTRLTNAFSKKVENLAAAVAVHFMHYNFCRPHMSLKGKTPAQAAGVTSRRWTCDDMIRLLEEAENSKA
jgi:IS1 family transposase